MAKANYEIIQNESGGLIKSWTQGVAFEAQAREQLIRLSQLPFIHKWVAAMPDVHAGKGATVGSVIPTRGAIIPAAVGVDIGCGMMAVKTSMKAEDLPDSLSGIRSEIERVVPVGHASHQYVPKSVETEWAKLVKGYEAILEKHPSVENSKKERQLATLGGGNHFIEICLDESAHVWIMLHTGSRGVGNLIGQYFIELAKKDMEKWFINLPDQDLAYFPEGTDHFTDYIQAVNWAQEFARVNRELMMTHVIGALRQDDKLPQFVLLDKAVNCHHNYVAMEHHYGANIYVTRKGAVRARKGDLGIIPGSMGARSFIVRGLGNEESFQSCSHGAGRIMSRTKAKEMISLEDHRKATQGVECRKDEGVLDESPKAYKDIDSVMAAQADLVEIVSTLKQVVCIKG